ncbi:hypothetical protein QE152_g7542 [Popillia japonica]|uniref:Uncharacterized protein n=1 Tax=Popillia japonica TaxID=7064 RepID=A0AAW1MG55_POPJA
MGKYERNGKKQKRMERNVEEGTGDRNSNMTPKGIRMRIRNVEEGTGDRNSNMTPKGIRVRIKYNASKLRATLLNILVQKNLNKAKIHHNFRFPILCVYTIVLVRESPRKAFRWKNWLIQQLEDINQQIPGNE